MNRSLLCGLVIAAAGAGCATRSDDGTPVSAAVGAVESGPTAGAPGGAATAGIPVVLTRPASVPANFLATPNGWFDPACVITLAADERVTADGTVLRPDGAVSRAARLCQSPHYDRQGRAIAASAKAGPGGAASTPTTNGWIEYVDSTAPGALSFVHAQWTVPPDPPSNTGQVVYYFPGLENASFVETILQPVLGWNQSEGPAGWSLASWNCCATGTTWHSTYLPTSAGNTVVGDMTGTNCNSGGVCTNWTITSSYPNGQGVTLTTTTDEAMNWLFGGVLEAYSIDTCNELPDSVSPPSTTFSGFSLRTASGTTVGTPTWNPHVLGQTPSCSYAVSTTSSSATLSWIAVPQVCSPFQDRPCCNIGGGCGCAGTQTCAADGRSWGACEGALPRTHECN